MQQARVQSWARMQGIAPEQLVLLDETGFGVGMSRSVARAEQGQKADRLRKFDCGKKMTLLGASKQGAVFTTKILEGSMKGHTFRAFSRLKLVPKLQARDVVVMDKLHAHHREAIREMIASVGAKIE